MQKSILTHERSRDHQKHTAPLQRSASPLSVGALYQQLQSSSSGLTTEEARKRLRQYGPNEPTVGRRGAPLQQVLVFLANPLVIILLIASIITAVLGEVLNASILFTMIFLSVVLNFSGLDPEKSGR